MNPEMVARMRQGSFVRVVLDQDAVVSGWMGADPDQPDSLRLDGLILNEAGYLEQISLRLLPDDIRAITYLVESPLFLDTDGHAMRMEPGFWDDPT